MVEVGKRNLTELCQKIKEEIRPNDKSSPNSRVDFAGYDLAVQEFRKMCDKDEGAMEDAENRIIVISALTLDERTITKMETAATKDAGTRIHSSFICIRNNRDVNWDRVQNQRERVYGIAGCNYYTLNSSEQLRDRLVTRFDETVCPLMLNLSVTVEVPSSGTECVAAVH